MEKPEMEWIDKLFNCMSEFYGTRWTKQFDRWMPESLLKTVWQSALQGCNYDEIRGALVLLKQAAKSPASIPPHHLEFYRFAKGTSHPVIINEPKQTNCNPEIARLALDEIKSKLHGGVRST
jgi:hypothetical protein